MAEIAWIKVHAQDQFQRLAQRLKRAGRGDLQRKLTQAVKREGDPALSAVRTAWGGVDVTSSGPGGYHSGLRARVAAATRIRVRGTGVRVEVDSARVDPRYGRTLVHGLDALFNWTHPLFGNRDRWYSQRGQEVFFSTLYGFEDEWRAGIEKAMQETAREIAG